MTNEAIVGKVKGNYITIAAIIVVILIFAFIIYKIYNAILLQRKLAQQRAEETNYTDASGNTVTIDLGAKATAIYNAFWDYALGLMEDEATAESNLLSVPKELIPKLETIYTSLFGKNLKNDFQKYDSGNWNSIAYLFA